MNKSRQINIAWYAVIDFISASLAWAIFYFLRKRLLHEAEAGANEWQVNAKFWLGISFIPVGWLVLYTLVGSYHSLYRKSRLSEFTSTFVCSLIGCIVLFFALVLDDVKNNYYYYYTAFLSLFSIHFILTFTGRFILLTKAKKQLLQGKISFNTLMVGSQD